MAVAADGVAAALVTISQEREYPVAQVAFGGGAQSDDHAAAGQALDLGRCHMRAMHQAPVLVEWHVVEQPLGRTLVAPAEAVVDFLDLFRDVHVDRSVRVDGT